MKHLTSDQFLEKTKALVSEERRVTLALIEHLEEIQRRMLYAELGYSSLWEFATKYLGLSEGAAQRRIQAMRLTRDVPEAKAALASGTLSLSNAAKVQSFRQAEKKRGMKHDARKLVQTVSNLSQRDCEQKLFELSPQALPQERERQVSAQGEREIKIVISVELHERLQRVRGMIAHAQPEASYAELLELMANETLVGLTKKNAIYAGVSLSQRVNVAGAGLSHDVNVGGNQQAIYSHDALPASTAVAAVALPSETESESTLPSPSLLHARLHSKTQNTAPSSQPPRLPPPGQRGYLPVAFRKSLGARSQGRCEAVTREGQRCGSRYRLQIDHCKPLALGGSNELSNLQIVCVNHNQQRALAAGVSIK